MCYSALVIQDLKYLGRRYGALAVKDQFASYEEASIGDSKLFPALKERIYPGYYAPVIFKQNGELVTELMRYGAYPPPHIKDPSRYSSFNARRDNLTSSFWCDAFMKHHGVVVLKGFYEWVAVKDLLKAGVVALKDVEAEFAHQSQFRKEKILASAKKWKPTLTELKPAIDRQIIIEFKPEDGDDLLVPVIFSYNQHPQAEGVHLPNAGFALITDDPTPEILRAGHDRCPIILGAKDLDSWLEFGSMTADKLQLFLQQSRRVTFKHGLPFAA